MLREDRPRAEQRFEQHLRKVDCRGVLQRLPIHQRPPRFHHPQPWTICLPLVEDGESVWGRDPVHPTKEGYSKIADLICEKAGRARGGKKRAGSHIEPPGKKMRMDIPRPRWLGEGSSSSMVHGGVQRGSGNEGGRGRRPWFRHPMRGGRF